MQQIMDLTDALRGVAQPLPAQRYPAVLTRYELARVIGTRMNELQHGDSPRVPVEDGCSAVDIAEAELKAGAIDMTIRRYRADGSHEDHQLRHLRIPALLR